MGRNSFEGRLWRRAHLRPWPIRFLIFIIAQVAWEVCDEKTRLQIPGAASHPSATAQGGSRKPREVGHTLANLAVHRETARKRTWRWRRSMKYLGVPSRLL